MSDYIAAEIKIGGRIPAALVPALCEAIAEQRLSLEWGDCVFQPHSAIDLLEAATNLDGVRMLRLYDDDAAWGEFPQLEAFLKQHGIPFDRFHEGKFDTDPGLLQFRPGAGCRDFPATSGGQIVALIQDLLPLRGEIATAVQQLTAGEHQQAAESLQAVLTVLERRLIEPVPLPVLEISEEPVLLAASSDSSA